MKSHPITPKQAELMALNIHSTHNDTHHSNVGSTSKARPRKPQSTGPKSHSPSAPATKSVRFSTPECTQYLDDEDDIPISKLSFSRSGDPSKLRLGTIQPILKMPTSPTTKSADHSSPVHSSERDNLAQPMATSEIKSLTTQLTKTQNECNKWKKL